VHDVAEWIKWQLKTHPNLNTIIHVTYSLGLQLSKVFPSFLVNTDKNKLKIIEKFKTKGGVWLASGCSEGLDLPGDICRLNLIPIVQMPNLADEWVKKRKAIRGGRQWYILLAIKQLQQQVGRSTRGATDKSIAIIGDSKIIRLVQENRKDFAPSFLDSLDWSYNESIQQRKKVQ
jgi:Rad3-related DNA helicase